MTVGWSRTLHRYVWPEGMSECSVGTGDLSEEEMQRALKLAQEYRQQLERKLELAKLNQARGLQEGQLIEAERGALVGACETDRGGAVIVEAEIEAVDALDATQAADALEEADAGYRFEDPSQCASASLRDEHAPRGQLIGEAEIEAPDAFDATQVAMGFEVSEPSFRAKESSHCDSASLIEEQETQAQLVAPIADGAHDRQCAKELTTTVSPPISSIVVVTDLKHESRDRDDDGGLAPGADCAAWFLQPAEVDPAIQCQGSHEGHLSGPAGERPYEERLYVTLQESEEAAILTSDTNDGATMSGMSPPARRGEEGTSCAFWCHGWPQSHPIGGQLSKENGEYVPRFSEATIAVRLQHRAATESASGEEHEAALERRVLEVTPDRSELRTGDRAYEPLEAAATCVAATTDASQTKACAPQKRMELDPEQATEDESEEFDADEGP
ncbi:hypothetical protein HPB49_022232 [Dermacentor silvarum]|uniref:Uncharacterized protein n=1 Tax=Dermacentor silvarum TaxID=543639 RepID=A0ACB8E346_DERSI|nr:hypothetical protein HPB49_022232 [Dermacentor silvarum]